MSDVETPMASPRTPTVPRYHGAPVPSMIRALMIFKSSMGDLEVVAQAATNVIPTLSKAKGRERCARAARERRQNGAARPHRFFATLRMTFLIASLAPDPP